MIIDFYLDPACPWCWATSRWLVEVQPHRDFEIRWQPLSLWRKNKDTLPGEYLDAVFTTHQMLRVCEAVRESAGNDAVGRFYTVIGTAIHHDGLQTFDLGDALRAAGCDPALAGAADDQTWDALIAAEMDQGLALTGDDVGTPILGFDGRAAIFGPIISPIPTGDQALALFDAVVTLTNLEGFWELKRTRTVHPQLHDRPPVRHLEGALRPVS
jgi:hypothetical protein